ncbi:uncharacterized protein LOC118768100 [Octopus sinensis]|uniref:Uncharacterized protein LOC118768100 n=1 Tax=Octopus sinensis TaxID=2607531 RepID=A0A7E6FQG7_9MOLL|nr:uncharacterized protein LOC118768100 [Octopus sinensis]
MNLKGMETTIQYHSIPLLLPALTLLLFVTLVTAGEPTNREGHFKKTTTSKCLIDENKTTKTASSRLECASLCLSRDECQYFSYCNGPCYMHRSLYNEEIKDQDCTCLSYVLLSGNSKSWQKVFEMTKTSFKKSPIYLYWDNLPIEKVEFRLKKPSDDDVFIFRGTGTNSTSWFQKDKIIVQQWHTVMVTFNAKFDKKIDEGTIDFVWDYI